MRGNGWLLRSIQTDGTIRHTDGLSWNSLCQICFYSRRIMLLLQVRRAVSIWFVYTRIVQSKCYRLDSIRFNANEFPRADLAKLNATVRPKKKHRNRDTLAVCKHADKRRKLSSDRIKNEKTWEMLQQSRTERGSTNLDSKLPAIFI